MKKTSNKVDWQTAPDIFAQIKRIVQKLNLWHIDPHKIFCFRSKYSQTRARARIWSLPRIWQQALNINPYYIIEVISERFDRLSVSDQKRVLIHELMHIPKTFSGSLVPHRGKYHRIDHQTVELLFQKFLRGCF